MRLLRHATLLASLATLSFGFTTELPAQSLRGSRASVNRMYERARGQGLHFYKTVAGVNAAARRGDFVRLRSSADYAVASWVIPYVVPETRTFVQRLASQYRAACGERLVVTSAIRPTSRQPRNSVARSVHPTGMAIDLRKSDRASCRTWLRRTLVALERRGVLEATEEHYPPHFHVAVFPSRYSRYVRQLAAR